MGVARSELGESLEQGLACGALALKPGRLPGLMGEEVAARIEMRERERIGLSGGEPIEVGRRRGGWASPRGGGARVRRGGARAYRAACDLRNAAFIAAIVPPGLAVAPFPGVGPAAARLEG